MITSASAAKELIRRRKARSSLLDFVRYVRPRWIEGEHFALISDALHRVAGEPGRQLIITMPPRHGKSEIASRYFPGWFLGRNADKQLICATYGDDLSVEFGRDVRDIIRSEAYRALFPGVEIRRDASAAGAWRTTTGGIYVATGVGGALTGKGAHVLLIDDPFKNMEEADSQKHREKVWRWYQSVASTRLMPGASQVVIATRWNADDLTGRLLKQGGWEHLHLKAIEALPDGFEQVLWPEWFSLAEMQRRRERTVPRIWACLYQGDPNEEVGTYYSRDWFAERYDDTPKGCHVYICSDYAVTPPSEGEEPDYTEHGVFGLRGDKIYVLDWWYGQTESDKWIAELIRLVKRWSPLAVFGEAGVIARAVEPLRLTMSREARAYWRQAWIPSIHDKAIRGRAMQGRAACKRLVFGRQPWAERVISQLCGFPTAEHDDAFDVCSLMGVALESAHPAIVGTAEEPRKPRDRYGEPRQDGEASWRTV